MIFCLDRRRRREPGTGTCESCDAGGLGEQCDVLARGVLFFSIGRLCRGRCTRLRGCCLPAANLSRNRREPGPLSVCDINPPLLSAVVISTLAPSIAQVEVVRAAGA